MAGGPPMTRTAPRFESASSMVRVLVRRLPRWRGLCGPPEHPIDIGSWLDPVMLTASPGPLARRWAWARSSDGRRCGRPCLPLVNGLNSGVAAGMPAQIETLMDSLVDADASTVATALDAAET